MLRYRIAAVFLAFVLTACGSSKTSQPAAKPPDEQVRALADEYLAGFFEHTPEAVTYNGVPGKRHDKLSDNSLTAQKAWEAREDSWLAQLRQLEPRRIESAPLRATYAIVKQTLEGSIAKRVCRDELWNVSQMTGWQVAYGYLVTIQP